MPALTDGTIRNAIKRAGKMGRDETLADGEGRGTGRLVLIVKSMPARVTADWYAQQWRDGKRTKAKLGTYPTLSLADARERFQRDYAVAIRRGSSIKVTEDTRPGSVGDLFDAYVSHLRDSGKRSWHDYQQHLTKAADLMGKGRPARDIEPTDVLAALKPIYARGARSMADHARSYIRSAFAWGIKSERDYRSEAPRRFRIVHNPAADIPTEPKVVGERWLREEEWLRLYRWLEHPSALVHPPYCRAVQLLMLTGQRVEEIAALSVRQYDRAERILDWSTTKAGRPHAIPLPQLAVDLLEGVVPVNGWYFPSMMDATKPVSHGTLYSFMWRQRDAGVIPSVSNRDLRRTWKTLAGQAGVPREIRDRIQNHALQDVGSRNYDRWSYMPEKRAAMVQWDAFVRAMLGKEERAAA